MQSFKEKFIKTSLEKKSLEGRDNRYIRGSSIGFCKRRNAYSILGYQPLPSTGQGAFTLDLGNAIHDYLQMHLVRMGWIKAKPVLSEQGNIDWEQTEDPLSGCELDITDHDIRVKGHLDGITVPMVKHGEGLEAYHPDPDNPEAERYLIEIKSITDRPSFWILGIRDGGKHTITESEYPSEFIEVDMAVLESGKVQQRLSKFQHTRKVDKGGYLREFPVYKVSIGGKEELVTVQMIGNSAGSYTAIKEPKPAHIAQASLYAHHYGIKKILFIYVGKDVRGDYGDVSSLFNIPIKIFEHNVCEFDVDTLRSKLLETYEWADQGLLPPRDYALEEKMSECKYCPFLHHCYPGAIDIAPINEQLVKIGQEPLKEGPGVMHEYEKDLRTIYGEREIK